MTAVISEHPYTVALTGGIASGKTLVSDTFARLGATVIDTDVIAHQIVKPGQVALNKIIEEFGDSIVDENGNLRRKYLRALIFSDVNAREKLESILHPVIRQEVAKAISRVRAGYCIVVIPLLAEREAYPFIDRVLVVDTDRETQITRLMARDNSSRKHAKQALASQASREQRLAIADDVLDNSGLPGDVQLVVSELHKRYVKLAGMIRPRH